MSRFRHLLILCIASAPFVQAAPEPEKLYRVLPDAVTPSLSAPGKFDVGVRTITATNKEQTELYSGKLMDRKLKLEVWYPAQQRGAAPTHYDDQTRSGKPFSIQAGAYRDAPVRRSEKPYPLVVLSHGYTGYRTIMFYLGEHLASHGFVVVGIDHTDSTNADIDFAKAPFAGFPSTLMNRARDQVFAIEAIKGDSTLSSLTDTDSVGVIGYSMGGYGAVNTAGGCYAFTPEQAAQFTGTTDQALVPALQKRLNTCSSAKGEAGQADPRIKAVIAMAPWGGTQKVFDPESLAQISLPVLYVGGEFDDISGYEGIRWLYEHTGSAQSQLLTIHNARHNIAPHPAPAAAYEVEFDLGHYFEPAWRTQTLNLITEHFALAWMQCYIQSLAAACDMLTVDGESDQKSPDGKPVAPWKGFDDRYALGLRMEHKASK